MNSKPLTYDSLKTVLQHLDANTRLLISARIPSISVTERSVPLKIECLHFSNSQFVINKTRYSLTVCSEESSFHNDVDEYGELDEISGRTVLPGDVVFKPLDPHPVPPAMTEERMNEKIGNYEEILRNQRERLALLESMAPENFVEAPGNYNQDHFNTFRNGNEAQMRALGNSPEVEASRRFAITMTEATIEMNEKCLRPLLNRRDNVRANFEIKLEITSPSGVRTERVKYTAKLRSAEKSILKMMFGNRKHCVQVKKLIIWYCALIRFPLGFRMRIRELELFGNIRNTHSALNPVVVGSTYPLEKLGVGYEDGQDMTHEIVQSAKSLTLFFGSRDTPMLPVYLNLQTKKVQATDHRSMTAEEHVQLIKRWLEVGKPNGTCYTFPMLNEQGGKEIIEMVEQQCDGAVVEDKCVVIPMNVSSELKVSNACVPVETNEYWSFRMEVLPRGSLIVLSNYL